MLVEKCNGNPVPSAVCFHVSGSHESYLLVLPLETEPRFVGGVRKKGSGPSSAAASYQNAATREAADLASWLERRGVDQMLAEDPCFG